MNKTFVALGWDVLHDFEHDPYRQEVRIERSDRRAHGRADYAFSLAPAFQRVRFLLEAKRPQYDILTPDNCFQAIRYSWPLGLPLVVLSDFQSIHILDSRFKPNIGSATQRVVKSWCLEDYLDEKRFAELYWLLSREAVAADSIDRFSAIFLIEQGAAARRYTLLPGETRDFDDDFLAQLDGWRADLASGFKRARPSLTGEQLTEAVQRALDRLVFIRFLEAKAIEPDSIITAFGAGRHPAWKDFVAASRRLDTTYNGVVFKRHPVLDDPAFTPDNAAFEKICDELTDTHSPYNFGALPIELLGRVYERFLGKVVEVERSRINIVEKEDVRKAGGVYYTPDYVVSYIIEQALGPQVEGRSVEQILQLRIIDTACGSGSFLIGAFDYLLKAVLARYVAGTSRPKRGHVVRRDGQTHLTMAAKREVLTSCIYGVDIDPQAVEVAQLSLYLKLMEDETTASAHTQQIEMRGALLPPLVKNIVEGNSLVTLDEDLFQAEKLRATKSLDFQATFRRVFEEGGFDLVVGNPPYIKEYTNRAAFDHVRDSPYYEGKMDLWYLFAARGLDWLKSDTGVLAFIATNNWTTNAGAKKLRSKVVTETRIEQLVDFGDYKVFRDAGIQTMILILRRSASPSRYDFTYRKLQTRQPGLADARGLLDGQPGEGRTFLTPQLDRSRAPSSPLTFSADHAEQLLARIEAKRNFELDGTKEVAQGVVPNPDVLTAKGLEKIPQARRSTLNLRIGDGVFVVSETKFPTPKSSEKAFLKPLYEPTDVERYVVTKPSRLRLIYSVKARTRNDTPPERLLEHLKSYREVMEDRRETKDGRLSYHHLHWPRSERFFVKGPKILAVRKCASPTFAYTEEEAYVMMAFNVITSTRINLKYLTGILNSDVVRFWLRHKGKMQGHNYQLDKEPLLAIPIHSPSQREQERIAKLVERVIERRLEIEKSSTASERERAERLLDESEDALQRDIARLYGLSSTELESLRVDLAS